MGCSRVLHSGHRLGNFGCLRLRLSLQLDRGESRGSKGRDPFLCAVMKLTHELDEGMPSAGMLDDCRVAADTALVAETTRETATQDKENGTTINFPCTRDKNVACWWIR